MSAVRDLLAAGMNAQAVDHRSTEPPPARRFRLSGSLETVHPLPNGLYPHELEGRIIALRHVTVVPTRLTGEHSYDCIVVASDHHSYPVGGYHLSVSIAELGSGVLHDGPRPVGEPPTGEHGDEGGEGDGDGPVTDDDFAAFADGAGFDPGMLPEPTDEELAAMHGPSTETLEDHLLSFEGDSHGLIDHLVAVHDVPRTTLPDAPPLDAGGWEALDELHRRQHRAGAPDA